MKVVLIFLGLIAGGLGGLLATGLTVGGGLLISGAVLFSAGCLLFSMESAAEAAAKRDQTTQKLLAAIRDSQPPVPPPLP